MRGLPGRRGPLPDRCPPDAGLAERPLTSSPKKPPPEPDPELETLIWLQKTREKRLADARRGT
ncbi:hypothetical protein GCM10010328_28310 [Streptomyces rubiginosohelvolus]|uniref:Uncharacterized protein n=1 Tax=Streptomyces rubiginosohelvolus TaxID=67362 RepID=A0ABQ3BRC8_9ACTN|nr:hypothetical protein GCM10010328_28310 [Streptomyces pluricolorescens]